MLTNHKKGTVIGAFFMHLTQWLSSTPNRAATVFVFIVLGFGITPIASAGSSQQLEVKQLPKCLSNLPTQPVSVQRITDGDTIVLSDERRVRLIGMNTLELNVKSPGERAWAHAATEALEKFLRTGSVSIISGVETHDRHGRLLAHVIGRDGLNASHELVSQGLAIAIAVGQNTRCANELQTREQMAQRAVLGLWGTSGNWRLDKPRMSGAERGFRIISGLVKHLEGRGKRRSLILDNGLTVRLGKHWPDHDKSTQKLLNSIVGKRIQVKGWLGGSAGKSYMTLHHPANLDVAAR